MKIRYDRDEDILTIETMAESTLDYAKQTAPFIAHFDASGQLLLLRILDASECMAPLIKAAMHGDTLPVGSGR